MLISKIASMDVRSLGLLLGKVTELREGGESDLTSVFTSHNSSK